MRKKVDGLRQRLEKLCGNEGKGQKNAAYDLLKTYCPHLVLDI
jgi:hypothetical protein